MSSIPLDNFAPLTPLESSGRSASGTNGSNTDSFDTHLFVAPTNGGESKPSKSVAVADKHGADEHRVERIDQPAVAADTPDDGTNTSDNSDTESAGATVAESNDTDNQESRKSENETPTEEESPNSVIEDDLHAAVTDTPLTTDEANLVETDLTISQNDGEDDDGSPKDSSPTDQTDTAPELVADKQMATKSALANEASSDLVSDNNASSDGGGEHNSTTATELPEQEQTNDLPNSDASNRTTPSLAATVDSSNASATAETTLSHAPPLVDEQSATLANTEATETVITAADITETAGTLSATGEEPSINRSRVDSDVTPTVDISVDTEAGEDSGAESGKEQNEHQAEVIDVPAKSARRKTVDARQETSPTNSQTSAQTEPIASAMATAPQVNPDTGENSDPAAELSRSSSNEPASSSPTSPTPAIGGPPTNRVPQSVMLRRDQSTTEPGRLTEPEQTRFISRVARAFQAAGAGDGNIRIRLSPPELGSMSLEIRVDNGTITARVETESTMARNALLDNLGALQDRLAELDIKIDSFDVDVAERHDSNQADLFDRESGSGRRSNDSQENADDGSSEIETVANTQIEDGPLDVVI